MLRVLGQAWARMERGCFGIDYLPAAPPSRDRYERDDSNAPALPSLGGLHDLVDAGDDPRRKFQTVEMNLQDALSNAEAQRRICRNLCEHLTCCFFPLVQAFKHYQEHYTTSATKIPTATAGMYDEALSSRPGASAVVLSAAGEEEAAPSGWKDFKLEILEHSSPYSSCGSYANILLLLCFALLCVVVVIVCELESSGVWGGHQGCDPNRENHFLRWPVGAVSALAPMLCGIYALMCVRFDAARQFELAQEGAKADEEREEEAERRSRTRIARRKPPRTSRGMATNPTLSLIFGLASIWIGVPSPNPNPDPNPHTRP